MRLVQGLAMAGLLAGVTTLIGAGLPVGQEAATGEAREGAIPPAGAQEGDRGTLLALLRERLSETRLRIERYQQHERGIIDAIARLEAGESPEAITSTMRERVQQGAREIRNRRADDTPPAERANERGGATRGPIDPAVRERLLANLREHSPAMYERVRSLGQEQPEQRERVLQRLMPRIQQIQVVQGEDPELATLMIHELHANLDLMIHSRDLREAMQDPKADESRIAALRSGLRDALRRSFDAHLGVKQREVAGLEMKIEGLREEIRKREQLRDQFIERQADQIEGGGFPLSPRAGGRG